MTDALGLRSLATLWIALCLGGTTHAQAAAPPAQSTAPEADEGAPVAMSAPIQERLLLVPLALGHGRVVQLHARLCLPSSANPAALVLINHGTPPIRSDREKVKLGSWVVAIRRPLNGS